ncbi:IS3 family transposase [Streptomyces sp. YGL11-2]|uniref:IS3 family transposase n=1 Tax=Streptomyces sp. YGL11-2 TaxID=3414028 RepID=UPI003CF9A697
MSTQPTSIKHTTRLVRAGIAAPMGSVGDSCDNALAENLWMLIKTECIRGRVFATGTDVNVALFEYIDGFPPAHRIHRHRCQTPSPCTRRHLTAGNPRHLAIKPDRSAERRRPGTRLRLRFDLTER